MLPKCFRDEALIAEFSSEKEADAYVRPASRLIRLLRKACVQHFGRNGDRQQYVGDSADFLGTLRELLSGDYKDYRIQICVYEDPLDGATYIGSMALYADRVLIEKKLMDLLKGRPSVAALSLK